jgi:uncharacterized membrane protein HdeD (DUF308 family)
MAAIMVTNWWALALRGLAAIVFGLTSIMWPGLTLLVIIIFFGAYALVDGVFAVIGALRAEQIHGRSGALMLEGVLNIVIAAVCFLWPLTASVALVYLIALWAVISGIALTAAGVALIRYSGEWLLVAGGVLSIVLAIILVLAPATLGVALGVYALFFGATMVSAAFTIRNRTI